MKESKKIILIIIPPCLKESGNWDLGEGTYYLMSDAGEFLASHFCSGIGFAENDLISGRPERKQLFAEKYPQGYEVTTAMKLNLSFEEIQQKADKFEAS